MRSIRRALVVWILAGLAVVVAVSGVMVYAVARAALRAQLDAALAGRARAMGLLVIDENGALEFDYDRQPSEADFGVCVRLSDGEGREITRSPGWPLAGPADGAGAVGEPVFSSVRVGGSAWRRVVLAMHATAEVDGGGGAGGVGGEDRRSNGRVVVVEVLGRTDPVVRAERSVVAALGAGGGMALAGACAVVWFGVRRGLGPVRELGEAVGAIGPEDLRLASRGRGYPEELAPITAGLEGMLARVGEAMARERRFTDAAAHELRTPIAELRTMTEVAERWPEPERLRRVVGEARGVAGEMEGLLASLLAVARGGGEDDGGVETVGLLEAVRRVAGEVRGRSPARGLSWTVAGEESAAWRARPAAVAAMVRNLLENAVAYTGEGGEVRVTVSAEEGGGAIVVANRPVSLNAEQVGRMFEPFWRADAARSDRAHRGLGLAIVESLAGVSGVVCSAELVEGGWLRVVLRRARDGGAA